MAAEDVYKRQGYIRHELGRMLSLRHVPELIFKATDSIEYGANISRMLQDLEKKEPEAVPEEDSEENGDGSRC